VWNNQQVVCCRQFDGSLRNLQWDWHRPASEMKMRGAMFGCINAIRESGLVPLAEKQDYDKFFIWGKFTSGTGNKVIARLDLPDGGSPGNWPQPIVIWEKERIAEALEVDLNAANEFCVKIEGSMKKSREAYLARVDAEKKQCL